MAKDTHERLLEWLSDAHAMEKESETLLSTLAGRIEHYPELKQRLREHVAETHQQAELLLGCIERLGGSSPALKGFMAKAMGSLEATVLQFLWREQNPELAAKR